MKRMRVLILIILQLAISIYISAQEFKCSLPSNTNDTLYYFIDSLKTKDIDCFDLKPRMIKKISVIKHKGQKNIYGNPKGGVVWIQLKRQYRSNEIGELLKPYIFSLNYNQKYFLNDIELSRKAFCSITIDGLREINFIK